MRLRSGICSHCGFSWSSSPETVIASLRSSHVRFGEAISGSPEEQLRQRPFPESWSALEYIAHTRDGVSWYEERIRKTLSVERPRLTKADFALRTEKSQYHRESTDSVLQGLRESSERLASLLATLSPEQWSREAIGSDGDKRDVLQLAQRAAHETEHHCEDAKIALRDSSV